MPLQTANQYDLVPQFSNIGTGISQGMQLRGQFDQRKAAEAQQAQKQQISQFSQQALAGDKEAAGKLAGLDPNVALNIQKILAGNDEAANKELIRENENMTRGALNVLEISGGDPAKARVALQNLERQWAANGLKTDLTKGALALDDTAMMQALNQQGTQGLAIDDYAKSVLGVDQGLTSGQREFASDMKLAGATEEEIKRAITNKYGITPRAGESAEERIARDAALAVQVAESQSQIAESKEAGKLEAQGKLLPAIRANIKQAEKEAAARGDTNIELISAKAAMPGLTKVVDRLKLLADDATFTLGGSAFNAIAKELGFSTKGGTSRASMVSIVDNQVLPLLKPIFGAAFTAIEGDRLRNAFLDPDATPESRKAQVQSFLEQMQRNIETKERELAASSGQQSPQGAQQKEGGQIMIDANGNRAMVFPDGTFEEL